MIHERGVQELKKKMQNSNDQVFLMIVSQTLYFARYIHVPSLAGWNMNNHSKAGYQDYLGKNPTRF